MMEHLSSLNGAEFDKACGRHAVEAHEKAIKLFRTEAQSGQDPELKAFVGKVADSGEGRWTVDAAIEEEVPAEVLTAALYARFRSRRDHTFGEKLLSALRAQFGGHVERPR